MAYRLELQKTILERVGSVKDLGEFLTTEQGEETPAPWRRRSFVRSCASCRPSRLSIMFLVVGMFLMFFTEVPRRSGFEERLAGAPHGHPILLVAIGVALLVSAVISFS